GAKGVAFNSGGAVLSITNDLILANGTVLDMAGGSNGYSNTLSFSGSSSQTLGGNGEINFGANTNYSKLANNVIDITAITAPVTFGPGILVHGKFATVQMYHGGIINQGTMAADIAGGNFRLYGNFTNQGTVQAINGGSVDLAT